MNKTVYLRDEEVPIWERARELADDKVSPVIVAALKRFITEKEAEAAQAKGFERITVKFNDADAHFIPRIKVFQGRWIIPPNERETTYNEDRDTRWRYSVAVTAKGAAVVHWVEEDSEGQAEHFRVYPSLESAAADSKVSWAARKAIEILGVPVEELDI